MQRNRSSKRPPLVRASAWSAGLALALLAAVTLGRCGELPEDRCAEAGIYSSVGNQFMSPDGLYACVCELDGTLVCRRTGADAGPGDVAATSAGPERAADRD